MQQNKLVIGIIILSFATIAVMMKLITQRPIVPVEECRINISKLGKALILYACDNHGYLPPLEGDKNSHHHRWVYALENYVTMKGFNTKIASSLKCPRDGTSGVESYEVNPLLANKRIDQISSHDAARTVLLFEKYYHGSHRYVYYLDGHVERQYH